MATLIYNVTDLQNMQNNLSGDYELANDIDATGFSFTAIGYFTGTLDGKGYTISNLTVATSRSGYAGLFSSANANVSDLKLRDVTVNHGTCNCGAMIGNAWYCTFQRCSVTGTVRGKGGISSGTGGFVGSSGGCTYTDCWSDCTITIASDRAGGGFVGGLILDKDNTFTRCFAKGSITGGCWTGGFLGSTGFYHWMDVTCRECYSEVDVVAYGQSGSGCYAGGFVGHHYQGVIKCYDCYARGDVTGTWPGHTACVGGFVGGGYYESYPCTFDNCYSTGYVSGNGKLGGFAGDAMSGWTVTDCFWDQETSGQLTSDGVATGQTTLQMKTQSTFTDAGWDFETVWRMNSLINDGYPYLEWSRWLLTIYATAGGTVVTPGTGIFAYELDEVVDLLAVPGAERSFIEWTGDTSTIDDTSNAETTILMNDHFTITANFSGIALYPTDALIRASSIRRIFRPGIYRMEVQLGDLGIDIDVVDMGVKKITEGVEEPGEPEEIAMPTPDEIAEANRRFWEESWPKAMESAGAMYTEPPIVSGKWTAPAPGPPKIPGLNNYLLTWPSGKKVIVAAKSTAAAYTVAGVPLWEMGLVTVKKIS